MELEKLKTIFLDIDGTLIYHYGFPRKQSFYEPVLLPGVEEKLNEWEEKGYRIILTTARKESERELTIKQLSRLSIHYDLLIMGLNRGERIIINDMSPNSNELRARAINVKRNKGLNNIEL
jgi:uncharacterized HAD superfamily protein